MRRAALTSSSMLVLAGDPRATAAASIPTRTQNVKTSAAVGEPDSCSTKREVRAPGQGEPVARERFAERNNA